MTRLAWSLLALLPLGATADEIYRSVDENGIVAYSDRPTANSEEIVVKAQRPSSSAQDSTPPTQPRPTTAGSRLVAELPQRQRPPAEIAANRAANCEVARQTAETYNNSRRLFRTLPDGEREYLSDEELLAARASAESDVAYWCD